MNDTLVDGNMCQLCSASFVGRYFYIFIEFISFLRLLLRVAFVPCEVVPSNAVKYAPEHNKNECLTFGCRPAAVSLYVHKHINCRVKNCQYHFISAHWTLWKRKSREVSIVRNDKLKYGSPVTITCFIFSQPLSHEWLEGEVFSGAERIERNFVQCSIGDSFVFLTMKHFSSE